MTGSDSDAQTRDGRQSDRGRDQLVRHRAGLRARDDRKRTSDVCSLNSGRMGYMSRRRSACPPRPSTASAEYVRRSVAESLQRLRVPHVTLLQLHNGITPARGDEPASLAPRRRPRADRGCIPAIAGGGRGALSRADRNGHAGRDREVIRSGLVRHLASAVQHPESECRPAIGDPR